MNKLQGILKTVFSPKYLLLTNTLSYGVLMGVGDSGLQLVNRYIEKLKIDKELKDYKSKANQSVVESSPEILSKNEILKSAKYQSMDWERVG